MLIKTKGGVRYTEDMEACLCEHCDSEIKRGSDYAVQYSAPYACIYDWMGPYCHKCLPKVKICCTCNYPYFPPNIKDIGECKWVCKGCSEKEE